MASQGLDLFGPDPAQDPLAWYAPDDRKADMFASAPDYVAQCWRSVASGLCGLPGGLGNAQEWIDRQVADLGLAFRMTGDVEERPWPLSPLPILIGAQEWQGIETGLVQRADLLEALIADIYGPQRLVAEGHLPAAAVSGSADFARRMVGLPPSGGHYLKVCAIDLARGPTGEWRVLADRVRLPIGIGYALQNRLAMSRIAGPLLGNIRARRIGDFFNTLREGIAAGCRRVDPRIGLLTPGRFNQSYPEQAHLARHLGFSLVEGRDLVEREGRLYVRTIAGLKRIDALWRWINARDIDPLAFDAQSRIGVPNLLHACASGDLVLANWPGAGVVEARAMSAFMPRLCRELLGESLRLPNAATWWCGQPGERDHVLANLDDLVISPAFRLPVAGLPDARTRVISRMDEPERAALLTGMERRPMDYVGQELVRISTTPTLEGRHFAPRGFTVRVYLARDGSGRWTAMPGGFARVSQQGELRTALMGANDRSADLCIVDPADTPHSTQPPRQEAPHIRRAQGVLSSQAADNLFWLGRYSERANQTVRVVRAMLDSRDTTGAGAHGPASVTSSLRLAGLLGKLGASEAATVTASQPLSFIAEEALGNASLPGSVAALAANSRQISLLLRDRLTHDSWRIVNRPLPGLGQDDDSRGAACDLMVERFAALARLLDDTMSRGPAWQFLQLGMSVERASMILQATLALVPGEASAEDLAALLDLVDGQAAYRSRYLSMPYIAPTLDMVLLDPAQPRGLACQAGAIVEILDDLPALREDGMTEPPLRLARKLRARLNELDAAELQPEILRGLLAIVGQVSEEIGKRYFLHEDLPGESGQGPLLG